MSCPVGYIKKLFKTWVFYTKNGSAKPPYDIYTYMPTLVEHVLHNSK